MRWIGILALLALVASIARVGLAGDATASAVGPIIFLDRGVGSAFSIAGHVDYSQLRREFVRQSFLLAAREELGWKTEDAWLGEQVDHSKAIVAFDVVAVPGPINQIDVLVGPNPQQKRVESVPVPEAAFRDDGSMLAACEALSREQFPRILKIGAGAEAATHLKPGSAALPEEVGEQLERMAFCAQFTAVRTIHREIATHGESPALLGGLIRAYAHLGMLTQGLCSPSFRVYSARALLYAQRWHARDPKSLLAIWHLAYAEAICGLHALAIQNLDQAEMLQAAAPVAERVAPPTWLPLIRASVFYEVKPLREAVDQQPHSQLASLLLMILYDQSGTPNLAIKHALKSLEKMPDCYRMHDELTMLGGVSLGHRTTLLTPRMFALQLYRELASIPDVPQQVLVLIQPRAFIKDLLNDDEAAAEQMERMKLVGSLYAAAAEPAEATGRAAEPSWAALGAWIEDTSFQQVFRRSHFLVVFLGSEAGDYLDSVRPLFEHHRYRAVIESFRDSQAEKQAAGDQLRQLPLHGLDLRQRRLWDFFAETDRDEANSIWYLLKCSMDETVNDHRFICRLFQKPDDSVVEAIARTSPRNPFAMALLIERHWDRFKDRADQFADLAHQHPRLAQALGSAYANSKDYAKAQKFFKESIALDPSLDGYGALAHTYLMQGDIEQFRRTYENYLKEVPDFNLDHAMANNFVAWAYIRRGEWQKARPFAEKAASSGAAFALSTVATVYEKLGEFEKADEIYGAIVDRYGTDNAWDWYYFCLRTGQGRVDLARAKQQEDLQEKRREQRGDHLRISATASAMQGANSEAIDIFQWQFEHASDPMDGLCAAMLADRLGNSERRDKLLAEVKRRAGQFTEAEGGSHRQSLIDLAAVLVDDLNNGGHAAFPLAKAEEICKRGRGLEVNMGAYILGDYLAQHGKMDDAERFWLRAVDEPMQGRCYFELASVRLKQAGIKPGDQDELRKKLGLQERWVSSD